MHSGCSEKGCVNNFTDQRWGNFEYYVRYYISQFFVKMRLYNRVHIKNIVKPITKYFLIYIINEDPWVKNIIFNLFFRKLYIFLSIIFLRMLNFFCYFAIFFLRLYTERWFIQGGDRMRMNHIICSRKSPLYLEIQVFDRTQFWITMYAYVCVAF